MSQEGIAILVENDADGNEIALAGIIGYYMGYPESLACSMIQMCNFFYDKDIKDYKDHTLYGIRMMIDAGAPITSDDIEYLTSRYPGEKFEECGDEINNGLLIGESCFSWYKNYDSYPVAKFNLTKKTVFFSFLEDKVLKDKDFSEIPMDVFMTFNSVFRSIYSVP